ncbi:MAG: tetratricopeptide repeat protein [Melioribacteraceae bacterium]
MLEKNNFVKDLNSLISECLTSEQSNSYFKTMMETVYPNSSEIVSTNELYSRIFNENLQSEKVRLFADTIITHISKELSEEKYIEFLLQFSKLILTQGENNLSYELASTVLTLCNSKKEFELLKAQGLLLTAEFYMKQAIWKDAVSSIKLSIEIFERNNFIAGLAKCEFLMGSMYVEKGDLKAGRVRLDNCLNYLNQSNDTQLTAMVEVHFGIISYIEGNFQKALDYYEKARTKFETHGDLRRKAEVLQNIGMIYQQQNHFTKALGIYNECIDIAKDKGYKPILNLSLINKAAIFLEQNAIEDSFKTAHEAMTLSYQLNDKLSIADIHKILGIISSRKENYSAAETYLLTSLRLNNELNQDLNAAETNYELGILYKTRGDRSRAFTHLLSAYKYYNKNNSKSLSVEIESHLSSLTI